MQASCELSLWRHIHLTVRFYGKPKTTIKAAGCVIHSNGWCVILLAWGAGKEASSSSRREPGGEGKSYPCVS